MNLTVRLWIIVIAIFLAFVIHQFIIRPWLYQNGLLNTSEALQIRYQKYDNSVLVHMLPTGFWIWFDGRDILVYGEPTGRICNDDYDPAYMYDVQNRKSKGYVCADTLEKVKSFYNNKNIPYQYIFKRKFNPNFNVYDVINLLGDNNIIKIPPPPPTPTP